MEKVLSIHPIILVSVLFILQIFVFGYIIIGTWGGGTATFQAIGIFVILYEIFCFVLFFIWLWTIAIVLHKKLKELSINAEPFYFKTFYFTLLVSVILLGLFSTFYIFSLTKYFDEETLTMLKRFNDELGVFVGFLSFILIYLALGCFYFIFSWIGSVESQTEPKFIDTVPYLLLLLFLPAAVFFAQYKVRKLLMSRA